MQWVEVSDPLSLNGILRGYNVVCWENTTGTTANVIGVGATTNSTQVDLLLPFTAYGVQVRAFTVDGGIWSPPIIIWTDEEGKGDVNLYFMSMVRYKCDIAKSNYSIKVENS